MRFIFNLSIKEVLFDDVVKDSREGDGFQMIVVNHQSIDDFVNSALKYVHKSQIDSMLS